jgi:hypothetical protein
MYTLTIVVWAALGTAPAVDKTFTYPTFESCETQRLKLNTAYELELQNGNIAGYETGCKGK